jgi:hypothetical protein
LRRKLKRNLKLFIRRKWHKKVLLCNLTPHLVLRKRLHKLAGTWVQEMMKTMIKWEDSLDSRGKNQSANF